MWHMPKTCGTCYKSQVQTRESKRYQKRDNLAGRKKLEAPLVESKFHIFDHLHCTSGHVTCLFTLFTL